MWILVLGLGFFFNSFHKAAPSFNLLSFLFIYHSSNFSSTKANSMAIISSMHVPSYYRVFVPHCCLWLTQLTLYIQFSAQQSFPPKPLPLQVQVTVLCYMLKSMLHPFLTLQLIQNNSFIFQIIQGLFIQLNEAL